MGVETIAIGAIAASAVASTASAISAASNNRKSIQAQKDLYEQQRLDQLADYNERTGIEAQSKQLENIGVNPASVFAGGHVPSGSMPSVPSAPSAPVLENVGAAATGSISQMVEAVGTIQGYKERTARVQKLQQEYETEKFNTNLAKANSFLTEKYGDATWYADLMDKQNSAYLKYAQGDLAGAEKLYKDMLTNIAGEDYKMKKEDALQYAQLLQLTRENLSALTDLYNARTVTEKSVRVRNFAQANEANALAFESQTRKLGIEFDNVIKQVNSENTAATAQQALAKLREQLISDSNLSRQVRLAAEAECEKLDKKLQMYRNHPTSAALDETLDNFNEHFPVLGGFIKAFSKQ